jgi:predicted amidohydrolase YtcJ
MSGQVMDVGEVDINGSNWPLLEADAPPWPAESGKSGGPARERLTETIQGEGLKPVDGEINGSIGEVGNLRINGDILTMADCGPESLRTILVREGRIEAADPSPGSPPVATTNLAFGDRVVMPAFVDPHAHFESAAMALSETIDCRAPAHRTIDDVLQTISDHLGESDTSDWLCCQGNLFFDRKLADGRLPSRAELDSLGTDRPIVIRAGGHVSVLNTRGLEVSDVARYAGKSGMMGAAVVELDSDGQPTGVIAELDKALGLPQPSEQEIQNSLERAATELFLQYGVTSIGEISNTRFGLECMDRLIAEDRLGLKVSVLAWVPGTCSKAELAELFADLPFRASPERFDLVGVKVFCDGGYSSRNAATTLPYLNPDGSTSSNRGKIDLSQEQLTDLLLSAEALEGRLSVHANGERAQAAVCDAILGLNHMPAKATRIEHAGNILSDFEVLELWRQAEVRPVAQPVFIYNFGEALSTYLGEEINGSRFPFRRLHEAGWRIPGSSECDIGCEAEQTNPLFSVWCCVAREGFRGGEVERDQSVAVEEALRMHTLYAAEVLDQDCERGSIEAGKLADLIVLERDPRAVPVADLRNVRVD